MGELKPCPFCGAGERLLSVQTYDVQPDDYHSGYVTCGECDAEGARPGEWLGDKEEAEQAAITAWNTRPRTEGRGEGEPVAWQEAAEPFFRLAREVINPVNGERPWHADSKDWMVVFSFAGQSVTLGDLRRAAVASPIREPEISREALIKVLADHFGFRPYEQMAEDKSDLRGKVRDGYDVNEPTKSDLAEVADAILNLAPVGGRGEGWKPIIEAPRDGTYILAHVADRDADDRWAHLAGRAFVVRHEGKTSSGYDLGWSVHPGFGGCADDWFSGWQPLPPPPEEQGGMK